MTLKLVVYSYKMQLSIEVITKPGVIFQASTQTYRLGVARCWLLCFERHLIYERVNLLTEVFDPTREKLHVIRHLMDNCIDSTGKVISLLYPNFERWTYCEFCAVLAPC
jgi:hypothetical protein